MRYPDDLRCATIGSTALSYLDGGLGRPVLLLHGFTFNAWSFRHQIDSLERAGYRPIVPDNPGFGRTPLSPRFQARAEDYASLHASLLDHLGIQEPIPVMGHSLGGGMALFLAHRHPELVSSLILLAPAAEPSHKALRVARVASREGFDEVAPIFFTRDRLVNIARSAYGENGPPDEIIDGYVDGVNVVDAFGIVRTFFSPAFQSLSDHYASIEAPTLIVVGDADPHDAMGLVRRPSQEIPDARLVVLPDVGHCPHEEAPEALDALVLEFLR